MDRRAPPGLWESQTSWRSSLLSVEPQPDHKWFRNPQLSVLVCFWPRLRTSSATFRGALAAAWRSCCGVALLSAAIISQSPNVPSQSKQGRGAVSAELHTHRRRQQEDQICSDDDDGLMKLELHLLCADAATPNGPHRPTAQTARF